MKLFLVRVLHCSSFQVTGVDAPLPINSFEEIRLRDLLFENIKRSGYMKPTPVQKGAIPVVLNRRDMIASAVTGSGKTVELFPIFQLAVKSTILF